MSAPFPHPYRTAPDTLQSIRADLDAMLGRFDRLDVDPPEDVEPEAARALARLGRELSLRRALEEAAEHAAAMLPALGLPRLVGPGFAPPDREVALDALDAAIVALDALDGDPDLEDAGDDEPSLASPISGAPAGGSDDREEDETDREPSLGWPEDYTAKDTKRGPGFDEMEDDGQDLEDDELGDDRDPEPIAWVFRPSRREVAHV